MPASARRLMSLEHDLEAARLYTESLRSHFSFVEDRPLAIRRIEGALVTGRHYWLDGSFTGAVYDGEGALVRDTLRANPGDMPPADPPDLAEFGLHRSRARRIRRALYGGILFPAMGHLLIETLGRLWPKLRPGEEAADAPVCFHPWIYHRPETVFDNPLFRAWLAPFGATRWRSLIAFRDLAVDELFVPSPASIYHDHLHPVMGEVFDAISRSAAGRLRDGDRPVFLSRSRWTRGGARIADPKVLDALFADLGFEIVYPEVTSTARLIGRLASTRMLAATDGSQAHLAAFCRPGARAVILDTRYVPTQTALEQLRGLDAVHVQMAGSGFWQEGDGRLREPDRLARLLRTLCREG